MSVSLRVRYQMTDLEHIVRSSVASSVLAFRPNSYGANHQALLQDIMSLANAQGPGARYLCLGVDNSEGKRKLIGLDSVDIVHGQAYLEMIRTYIEPALEIEFRQVILESIAIGVFVISEPTETPYLMARDFSEFLFKGTGFIREHTEQRRLDRGDLKMLFQKSRKQSQRNMDIGVCFASKAFNTTIELPVLPLNRLPSESASDRIKSLMAAKAEADKAANVNDSRIERLTHARLFGHTAPYMQLTPQGLLEKLANTSAEHADADRYYTCELRAHKINFLLVNNSKQELKQATLTFEIPRSPGVELSEQIYSAPGSTTPIPTGYPALTLGKANIVSRTEWKRIPAGARLSTFSQPLRLQLREPVIGKSLSIRYILQAKNLKDIVVGTLTINVKPPKT